MLAITVRTGPKKHNEHELDTIEKIEAAWNGKRQLRVSLREKEQLHKGRVGMFGSSSYASTTLGFLHENASKLCQYEEVCTGLPSGHQKRSLLVPYRLPVWGL